ncbi:hypothetical protein EJB05_22076, partial [Eragrostis curvula]
MESGPCSTGLGHSRRSRSRRSDSGSGQTVFTAECTDQFDSLSVSRGTSGRDLPSYRSMPPSLPLPSAVPSQQFFRPMEPRLFDDDDPVERTPRPLRDDRRSSGARAEASSGGAVVALTTHCEYSALARDASADDFAVLLHARAPGAWAGGAAAPRAPLDLVTVLDVSGSMVGTKLALLKQAMGFVIDSLGPRDRLCVISFSSGASRLMRLARMSDAGKALARRAVGSLTAGGGTNIGEALRRAAKVIDERMHRNASRVDGDGDAASVDVGELYADEERRFQLFLHVPRAHAWDDVITQLVEVSCSYLDTATGRDKAVVGEVAAVQRPSRVETAERSAEVERERVRVEATDDIAAARAAAERGAHAEAVEILRNRQRAVARSSVAREGDTMCAALARELREMRARVADRRRYELSGRAYVLAGLSSHAQQRATSRQMTFVGGAEKKRSGEISSDEGTAWPWRRLALRRRT